MKKKTIKKKATKKKTAPKKPAPKKTTKKVVKKKTVKKPTVKKVKPKKVAKKQTIKKPAPKKVFMLRKSGLDKEGNQNYTAIRVYKKIPNGWKVDEGAKTAPIGYKWVTNGQSVFGGKRKTALVKV